VLAGPMRWFGIDGDIRLTFGPQGLSRLHWNAHRPAPHQRDYVEDALARAGYRRHCKRYDVRDRECTWNGALEVRVKCDSTTLTAEITGLGPDARRDQNVMSDDERERIAEQKRLEPYLADPAPILDDTLSLDPAALPGRHAAPTLLQAMPPDYSDALRARGVTGIVHVLALVGLDGRVTYTRATDGAPELRPLATDTLRRYRFSGYNDAGRKVRFWVWVPVRFGV
jgi:hypothetical protein